MKDVVRQAHCSVTRVPSISIAFCKKGGNFTEVGNPPKWKGVRSDLKRDETKAVRADVLEKIDTFDLIAEIKRRGGTLRITDHEILDEVKERELDEVILEEMDDEAFGSVMMARGVWPVFDARPTRLIHELRRQARNASIQAYYFDEKKRNLVHSSDEVGADILEKMDGVTRGAKKRKFVTHFEVCHIPNCCYWGNGFVVS